MCTAWDRVAPDGFFMANRQSSVTGQSSHNGQSSVNGQAGHNGASAWDGPWGASGRSRVARPRAGKTTADATISGRRAVTDGVVGRPGSHAPAVTCRRVGP